MDITGEISKITNAIELEIAHCENAIDIQHKLIEKGYDGDEELNRYSERLEFMIAERNNFFELTISNPLEAIQLYKEYVSVIGVKHEYVSQI